MDLLKSTGIQNISESAGEVSFSCPSDAHFHGDHSPSARMNRRTTAFICHGCGQSGNAITFLAWHKSLPETVARRLLEERYGGGGINAPVGTLESEVLKLQNPIVEIEEERIPPAESWLDEFYVDWTDESDIPSYLSEYMTERGFGPKICNEWQLGYDKISDRVTIPIFDIDSKLVGFKGRAWSDGPYPKYMILGDRPGENKYGFQPYKKSKYIFGLNKLDFIEDVVLVEGELNVIAMDQHDYNAIGIAGSEFSETQRDLVKAYCASVIVYLDNDKSGDKGTKQVIDMLNPYMPIKVVQNAAGDAADLDTKTVKELISSAQPVLSLQVQGLI